MLIPILVLIVATAPALAQEPLVPPLTLRAVMDSLAAHPGILAADARVRAAEGSRTTSRALGNPMLMWQDEQPRGIGAQGVQRETMLTVTLPLEPLYQRWSRISEAGAIVRGAEGSRALTRQETAMNAASAYYRVALAQVATTTARDRMAWLDSLVAYNRARVSEGAAAEADLIRARIERDLAAADAAMRQADLARARALLATFAGYARAAPLTVDVPSAPLALAPAADHATPSELDQVPDVRIARSRADAASAALVTERTMVLRQVGATFGTREMGGTTLTVAGISVPLPIFDLNRGQLSRAAAEKSAAALDLAGARRTAIADHQGAEDAARVLTERLAEFDGRGAEAFLARADDARRIALGAYREGAIPLMQLLDAAKAWGEARLTFYQLLFMQHEAALHLVMARGLDLMTNVPFVGPATPNR